MRSKNRTIVILIVNLAMSCFVTFAGRDEYN